MGPAGDPAGPIVVKLLTGWLPGASQLPWRLHEPTRPRLPSWRHRAGPRPCPAGPCPRRTRSSRPVTVPIVSLALPFTSSTTPLMPSSGPLFFSVITTFRSWWIRSFERPCVSWRCRLSVIPDGSRLPERPRRQTGDVGLSEPHSAAMQLNRDPLDDRVGFGVPRGRGIAPSP